MKTFKTDFFSLAEQLELENEDKDLVVRVYFLTEDDIDFACYYVNTRGQDDDFEFAYEFTDAIGWVASDIREKISKAFPAA